MRRNKRDNTKKWILVAGCVLIIAIIIILIVIFGSNSGADLNVENDNTNQNNFQDNNQIIEEDSDKTKNENQETSEEVEEPGEPVYRDLSLEEAWEIALNNNVILHVKGDSVNVRALPTTESDKVGLAVKDSEVYVICEESTADGYVWCYVIYDKTESDRTVDADGNPMISIENKHHLGYIRKDLLY